MTISLESSHFSSNNEQDKTEWQSVWRIGISVLTLHRQGTHEWQWVWTITTCSDTGHGKNEWQSVWRITTCSDTGQDKTELQ